MERTNVPDQPGIGSIALVDPWVVTTRFPPPEAELVLMVRAIVRTGEWLLIRVHEMDFPHPEGRPDALRRDIAIWSGCALDFIRRARPSYEAPLGVALGGLYRGPVTRVVVRGREVIDERAELAQPVASALQVLERAFAERPGTAPRTCREPGPRGL